MRRKYELASTDRHRILFYSRFDCCCSVSLSSNMGAWWALSSGIVANYHPKNPTKNFDSPFSQPDFYGNNQEMTRLWWFPRRDGFSLDNFFAEMGTTKRSLLNAYRNFRS
jgi:hypothetical protein